MSGAWFTWVGLLLTPVLIATGQLLFKLTSMRLEARVGAKLYQALFDPYLISALAIYGAATVLWVHVLRNMPLSQAYPLMAVSFILVPIASSVLLGEPLSVRYWVGAALIFGGMLVINT